MDSERIGTSIRITRMDVDEGLSLLLHNSNREANDADKGHICEKLGYLPLAIDQASAYIAVRRLPLPEFLVHYKAREEEILNHIPSLWEYRRKFTNGRE